MLPGLNSRKAAQLMKRMGIQQVEIPAKRVIIETDDYDLVFTNPQVSKVNMMGTDTYQLAGQAEKQSKDTQPMITEEDITTVMEQTQCSRDEAVNAIERHAGDLAEAILALKS